MRLRGQVNSDSFTKEGPVTAYSNSMAEVEARRSLLANLGGIQAFDSYVAACLKSSFQGTDCLRIVTRIAERQFLKDQIRFEKEGAFRAEQKLKRQFDEQTDEALVNGQQQLSQQRSRAQQQFDQRQTEIQTKVAAELNARHGQRFRLLIPNLTMRTTDQELQISALAFDRDQLAAQSAPPAKTSDAGILIQVHESILSNILSHPFKGDTYSNKELPGLVKALAPEAEPLDVNQDDDFSITFDDGQPIQVLFDQDRITIVLAASRFQNKGTSYSQPFFVKQSFNLVNDNGLKLVGDGLPAVEFQKAGRKSTGETAFRRLLEDRIRESIQESLAKTGNDKLIVDLPPNLIPPRVIEELEDPTLVRGLNLVEFRSGNGWLTIGYQMDPSVRLPQNATTYHVGDGPVIQSLSDSPTIVPASRPLIHSISDSPKFVPVRAPSDR